MKKNIFICLLCLSAFMLLIPSLAADADTKASKSYGVFIGMEPSQISKLYNYSTVVIDASYFSAEEIKLLHDKNIKVYSYINLGSIENFRSYYKDFESITLGNYENWPEEKWIDVSSPKWQSYFVDVMAKELAAKGIDGFFIDNIDVYAVYKNQKTYDGVMSILKSLNTSCDLPIIANGGYEFFIAAKKNKVNLKSLIDGVNTESVFSAVDFGKKAFIKNSLTSRNFSLQYLKALKSLGINVYMIEYTKSASLIKEIEAYCKKNNFNYYITSSLNLD